MHTREIQRGIEKEREREGEGEGEAERGRERIPSRLCTVSEDSDLRLEF